MQADEITKSALPEIDISNLITEMWATILTVDTTQFDVPLTRKAHSGGRLFTGSKWRIKHDHRHHSYSGGVARRIWRQAPPSRLATISNKTNSSIDKDEIKWFFELQGSDKNYTNSEDLIKIINGLNSLMKKHDYEMINIILQTLETSNMSPEMLVAYSRTTYSIRSRITEWSYFITRAKSELSARGFDADKLMRGL